MSWYLFISVRTLAQDRTQLNEKTIYKYGVRLPQNGASLKEEHNMKSHHCPMTLRQEAVSRTWSEKAVAAIVGDCLLVGVIALSRAQLLPFLALREEAQETYVQTSDSTQPKSCQKSENSGTR